MSNVKFCKKINNYYEINKFLINSLKEIIKQEEIIIVGVSIYRKQYHKYINLHSLSLYYSDSNNLIISENDFAGFIFNDIHINDNYEKNKSHKYLKYFFKNINLNVEKDQENKYISLTFKNKKIQNYILQLYVVLKSDISKENYNNKLGYIKNNYFAKFQSVIDCICEYKLVKKINFKNNINIIKNKYILIIDLKRIRTFQSNVFQDIVMDALITYNFINEFKSIFSKYNFYVLNNTGDGFVFIYNNLEFNIKNDLKEALEEIKKFFLNIDIFNKELFLKKTIYKLRLIIEKCDYLFQINYGDHFGLKLYFSLNLDKIFNDILIFHAEENEIKFKDTKIFIYYKNDKYLDLKDLKDKLFIIKEIDERDRF